MPTMLALDIATTLGWAEGELGGAPRFGTHRFAPKGASQAEIFSGALEWIALRLGAFRPDILVFEAPFAPSVMRGHTNAQTSRVLLGIPAIVEGMAYRMGVPTIREVDVGDVRKHFLGKRNLPRPEAKRATMQRCRQIGLEVRTEDEADACACFDYASAILNPRTAALTSPLFAGARP